MVYGYTQRNSDLCGYSVKNGLDGLHEWHVYGKTEAESVELIANGVSSGAAAVQTLGSWKKVGSVFLPKGEHVVDLQCAEPIGNVLIANVLLLDEGAVQMAWTNRAGQVTFQQDRVDYTLRELKLLRRHGFLMHQPKDSQCMAAPSGMPLGGIGAGKLEITKDGQLTAFTGNNNQDSPIYRMPGSFFAVAVKEPELTACRLLQTTVVDQEMLPAASATHEAEYPVATWKFGVNPLPLDVTMTAWSAHVPGNAADSALPAVWFDITLGNRAVYPVETALCFSWENLINVGGSMKHSSNSDRILPLCYHTWNASYVWSDRTRNYSRAQGNAIRFWAEEDLGNPASFGEHIIWCSDPNAIANPDRSLEADELEFAKSLASCMSRPFTPTPEGEFRAGALTSLQKLQPGEKRTVRFILAWHMPHMPTSRGDAGVYYLNRFRNVEEVLSYAIENGDRLLEQSRQAAEFLKQSDLPAWFVRRLLNDRFVADTGTWFEKNGNFSVNEAPTGMSGCFGTLDQRAASQGFWCKFFPELDANELESFRLCQGEDGQCSHDIGFSEIEYRTTLHNQWPDLAAAYVHQVYHHWQRTGDREFIQLHYPHVKKAINWAMSMDDCDCGIPYIRKGRGTTYDNQHWEGVNSFIASVHTAMLYLTADMAKRMEDPDAETYLAMARRAEESRIRMLWDGKRGVFRNAYVNKTGEVDESTFIASLAGDWYLLSAGLRPGGEEDMLRTAAEGILRDCYLETGLTDQGGRKETAAFMQYPAAYYCAPAMLLGCDQEAWKAMAINDGAILTAPSNHFIQGLTYHIDGAARWALPYYMTSPATWNLLDAIAGLVPDLRDGTLKLQPRMEGKIPVVTQESWFMLDVSAERIRFLPIRSNRPQVYRAVIVDGKRHELPEGFDPGVTELVLSR